MIDEVPSCQVPSSQGPIPDLITWNLELETWNCLDAAPWLEPRTAYIHVPFCAHHCGYCDFAVAAGNDHLIDHYLDALALELATLGEPRPVETLFIGGGTPTYLNPDQLRRLLESINRWLPVPRGNEYSIESTPDSLDDEKAAVLAAHGVTRVSVGVQSFRPESLAALDRRHTPDADPAGRRSGAAARRWRCRST